VTTAALSGQAHARKGAPVDIQKDLVAASATPIVLSLLRQGDSYGYAIIRKVREVSGDRIAWTDGMLYPVLHRLEAAGFVRSTWKTADSGRRRKYYSITRQGEAELARLKEQWDVVHSALQRLAKPGKTGAKDV
jgi:PadR family transcriptional regulator PadR